MEKFWILILAAFFSTNSLDKAECVKLEGTSLKTFDEIFGEGWWDKGEAEDLKMPAATNFGQNVHHQIDRQNTQFGQIEPNSTDQLGQIEPNSTDQLGQIEPNSTERQIEPNSTDLNPLLTEFDHSGQIEPNSTDQLGQIEPNSNDQNPSLTESDHSDNAKIGEEQNEISSNENIVEDERKRKIIDKFHAMKDEFKQKGAFPYKEGAQIEEKIAKHLKVNRKKIYKWKKELGLSQQRHNFEKQKNEQKNLVEKFDQMKADLKRTGFKNSYQNQISKTVAKELGLSVMTIYRWKRKLGQTKTNKHSHSEKTELMKHYYEIKDKNPKISDEDIAKRLKIVSRTLIRWKKLFKRQHLHPNSVNEHSVEKNAAANVQEIENSNSENGQ
uniref:Uncharacterized protein n=1 Tax=Globodera rostochiensis TaxID=31243 RepID=A0A914I167_GLORO